MNPQHIADYRKRIAERRDALNEWLEEATEEERLRVSNGTLDGADTAAESVLPALDDALVRVDSGSFGVCVHGDGDVEEDRLVLDFTTCVCLAHFSADEIRALERDLEVAARLQQHLYPRKLPNLPDVRFASRATAGRIVGGDYVDFFQFRDGAQGAVIADVMGSGVAAALLVSNLQASLRIVGSEYEAPDELAARLNQLFRFNLRVHRFISLVLVRFEPTGDRITYTNAGHNPPLLRASTGACAWLSPTGPAIGLIAEPDFRSQEIHTNSGDLLVLYTDGVVEARAPGGDPFGDRRLLDIVTRHGDNTPDALVQQLWHAVTGHTEGSFDDDAALMVARFA